MKRPLLSALLPARLKERAYYQRFHSRHAEWPDLFSTASLSFCPEIRMFDLLPGDVISGNIAFHGFYELDLSKRISAHAREGSVFVDVGANMGYFSLLWTGLNPAGHAIAFEPAPRNLELLQNNVFRNHLADRVTVIPKAVGERAGTVVFDVGPAEQTGWGGVSTTTSKTSITVPVVRLDEELPDIGIDVLKIDVEGADTLVILGCEALLKAHRIGTIFFEQNTSRMESLGIGADVARKFLNNLGYSCEQAEGAWTAFPKNRAA